jgi:hypothetical protein
LVQIFNVQGHMHPLIRENLQANIDSIDQGKSTC